MVKLKIAKAHIKGFDREIVVFRSVEGYGFTPPPYPWNMQWEEIYAPMPLPHRLLPLASKERMISHIRQADTYILLVHGINPEELTAQQTDTFGLWETPYKHSVWVSAHRHLADIPGLQLIEVLYPSTLHGIDFHAHQIYRLLSDAGLERKRLIFIGHSMGGLVIRRLLSLYPTIRSTTLCTFLLGTPHRGSPLASLLFAPVEFWQWLSDRLDPIRYGFILLAMVMGFHSGSGVVAPGYLDLRWDDPRPFGFDEMANPILRRWAGCDAFRHTLIGAKLGRLPATESLPKLIDRMYYEPTDHLGLAILKHVTEELARAIGRDLWSETDGMVPLSSSIPSVYAYEGMQFDVLDVIQGDHIDLFTSERVWQLIRHRVVSLLGAS